MVPPLTTTEGTELLYAPIKSVPELTVIALPEGTALGEPNSTVPTLTVIPDLKLLEPVKLTIPLLVFELKVTNPPPATGARVLGTVNVVPAPASNSPPF